MHYLAYWVSKLCATVSEILFNRSSSKLLGASGDVKQSFAFAEEPK
jgi:hypothetical protein